MARFLTTRGTTSAIEDIINGAEKDIFLISAYIRIPDGLLQNLRAADDRGVRTTLVYGKDEKLDRSVMEQINQLKHVRLYFLKNLHAKCYFNEESMVITSLNLYDFSEQNNREMGVLVTKQDDEDVFNEADREAQRIIHLAIPSDFKMEVKEERKKQMKPQPNVENQKRKSSWLKDLSDTIETVSSVFGDAAGYCIGCKTEIEYTEKGSDAYKPYCIQCYKKLGKHKGQKAKYCHRCGCESGTSFDYPLCRSCFKKSSE